MELTWDSTDWAHPSKPMLEPKDSPTAVADGYGQSLVHRLARYRGGSWISA